jgi:hypothetical protein
MIVTVVMVVQVKFLLYRIFLLITLAVAVAVETLDTELLVWEGLAVEEMG